MRPLPLALAAVLSLPLLVPTAARGDTHVIHLDEWYDGHCTVCGGTYACADVNGTTTGVWTYVVTFDDPLPEGALLWEIDVVTYGINCNGGGAFAFVLNGNPLASGTDPNPNNCSCNTCDPPTTYEGAYHPNGMPGYVYGGINELVVEPTGNNYCLGYIELELQHLPCDQDDLDGDGWSDCDGDCDETDPAIHPGATEICDDGIDQNCDTQVDEYADDDGDGYSNCDGDCNDLEATAYPGAVEVCDFVDNDCDGWVDNGFDQDGDGWTTCSVPPDCDDARADVYPGALESCDGADNDCDGVIDEQGDEDNDGWTVCQGDCNDTDPLTFPGAPEQCDELDNDCDGQVPADEATDADGDGFVECLECDDADPAIYPGQQEICDGIDNNCDGNVDEGLEL